MKMVSYYIPFKDEEVEAERYTETKKHHKSQR